ncbi:hypothetical protein M5X06_22095 [Paenibacillus alvei]|uniref:Uncharacterized protein n=1 Tax=Paenibacillus alvei TaxID=44250 RepID=A0ABT4H2N1_PAEAL|nr:hypothetical protein [Paenibacillus alvei]MCY9763230.1 hypothetical protein [Paenibacillus alvei]MCY9769481.1 hypothetical protein [Paenibacillus alvei]
MSNVSKMVLYAAGIMLFLVGLWNVVEMNSIKSEMLEKADEFIYDQDLDLYQYPVIEGDYEVSGATLRQSIYHINETNITVTVQTINGLISFSPGLVIEETNLTGIQLNQMYKPTYTRAADGNITRIEYQ